MTILAHGNQRIQFVFCEILGYLARLPVLKKDFVAFHLARVELMHRSEESCQLLELSLRHRHATRANGLSSLGHFESQLAVRFGICCVLVERQGLVVLGLGDFQRLHETLAHVAPLLIGAATANKQSALIVFG